MAIKQIDHGSKEYLKMVQLRLDVLRKPLGLNFSEIELSNEINDILITAFDEEEILGCCILQTVDGNCIKLRQMAVQNKIQGKGIGVAIMSFAENLARDKGFKIIRMHARETAIGFYEKLGYEKKGNSFSEVNIPHLLMEKKL